MPFEICKMPSEPVDVYTYFELFGDGSLSTVSLYFYVRNLTSIYGFLSYWKMTKLLPLHFAFIKVLNVRAKTSLSFCTLNDIHQDFS